MTRPQVQALPTHALMGLAYSLEPGSASWIERAWALIELNRRRRLPALTRAEAALAQAIG